MQFSARFFFAPYYFCPKIALATDAPKMALLMAFFNGGPAKSRPLFSFPLFLKLGCETVLAKNPPLFFYRFKIIYYSL